MKGYLISTLRKRIAERLHIVAAAIEDGSIDIEHFDTLMLAMPSKYIPRQLYNQYNQWRRNNGPIA